MNPLISSPEISDAATVTASSESAVAPVINLQRMQPTDIWQASTLTPYVVIDLGSALAFNLIALLFTNATAAATWRIRTADTEAGLTSAPDYDSTAVTFSPWTTQADRRHGFAYYAAAKTNRWIRIDIDDSANPDGVFSAGRIYVDNAYLPSRNYSYGSARGFKDASQRNQTPAGNTIVNRQGIIPTLSMTIKLDNEDEYYANGHAIAMKRAGSRDVVVILDPDDATNGHDKIYYGLLSQAGRVINERFNVFTQTYELEGLI